MSRTSFKVLLSALFLAFAVGTAAHAAKPVADPIEPVNRAVFSFNNVLDRFLIEPLAKGYRAVVPKVVRSGVQNFMRNLRTPVTVANDLLQGRIGDAGTATARFIINTTVGVGGLVDVASAKEGLPYHSSDFGQTLATWGAGDGFYLVLPILGPSTLRDTAGLVVDNYADPVRIYARNTDREWIYYARAGLEGLDTRARLIEPIADMRRNSLDYYTAAKSAYMQRRSAIIYGQKTRLSVDGYDQNEDHP